MYGLAKVCTKVGLTISGSKAAYGVGIGRSRVSSLKAPPPTRVGGAVTGQKTNPRPSPPPTPCRWSDDW
jgi:hypothetical protein